MKCLLLIVVFLLGLNANAQTASDSTASATSPQKTEASASGFERVPPPSRAEMMQHYTKPSSKDKGMGKKDDWVKEMPPEQQFLLQSQMRKTQGATKVEKKKPQVTRGISTVRSSTKAGGASANAKKKAKQF